MSCTSGRKAASNVSRDGITCGSNSSGIGGSRAAASALRSVILEFTIRCQYTIKLMLAADKHVAAAPLTQLSEEETMFQDSVGRFAAERLAPHVRGMDEAGVFRKELLSEMF